MALVGDEIIRPSTRYVDTAIRVHKDAFRPSEAAFQYTDLSTDPPTTKDMSVSDFMEQMGISRPGDPDNYYDKNEWNTVLSNLKTESDTLSSTSQVDMMKLQSLLNKQQQAEAAASSIMKKADDAKTDNIRKW